MRGWVSLLLLLPLAFAFWLTKTVVNACVKKGSRWRLLGVLVSLVIGGICVQVGYWFTEEDITILGWIVIIGGGFIAVGGALQSLGMKKEQVELEELEKEQEKEWKELEQEWAKEEAKKTLEHGVIDDYERSAKICNILDRIGFDTEAVTLSQGLKDLKKKQEKELKKKQA